MNKNKGSIENDVTDIISELYSYRDNYEELEDLYIRWNDFSDNGIKERMQDVIATEQINITEKIEDSLEKLSSIKEEITGKLDNDKDRYYTTLDSIIEEIMSSISIETLEDIDILLDNMESILSIDETFKKKDKYIARSNEANLKKKIKDRKRNEVIAKREQGLSYQIIAEELKISVSTVKRYLKQDRSWING